MGTKAELDEKRRLQRRAKLVEALSDDPLCCKDRKNHTVEGFNFDQDMFENLIEYYTPKKDMADLLGVSEQKLDLFCMTIYGWNFSITYDKLSKRSQFLTRMALQNLGNSGNPAAIKVASETFWGLKTDAQSADLKIQVVANIPKSDEGNGSV